MRSSILCLLVLLMGAGGLPAQPDEAGLDGLGVGPVPEGADFRYFYSLGKAFSQAGKAEASAAAMDQALGLARGSGSSEATLGALVELAGRHAGDEDFDPADRIFREAAAVAGSLFGARDWRVGVVEHARANALASAARQAEAAAAYTSAAELLAEGAVSTQPVEISWLVGTPEPAATRPRNQAEHLARTLGDHAGMAHEQRHFEEAEALYRRAVEAAESSQGAEGPLVRSLLSSLRACLLEARKPDEAAEVASRLSGS